MFQMSLYGNKFFRKNINRIRKIPDEEWTFFPGDLVIVMLGKDKGKVGTISHIVRDYNAVFVDGLHTVIFLILHNILYVHL